MKQCFTPLASSLFLLFSLATPSMTMAVSAPPCLSQQSDEYEISVAIPDTLAPNATHIAWSVDGMELDEQTRRIRLQFGPYDEGTYLVAASDADKKEICTVSIELKARVAASDTYVDPYPVFRPENETNMAVRSPAAAAQSAERFDEIIRGGATGRSENAPQAKQEVQVDSGNTSPPPQKAGSLGTNLSGHHAISTPSVQNPQTRKSVHIKVYFVTERNYLPGTAALFGSARSPDGHLRYGIASVTVPTTHKRMFVGDPVYWRYSPQDFSASFAPLLSETDFYNNLILQVSAEAPGRQVFVFIHGFNNSFKEDIYKTAQLAYDTHFVGVPMMYDWPSKDGLVDYTADRTSMNNSIESLAEFLHNLAGRTGAVTVNIIAHSMGNRLLLEALNRLQLQNRLPALGQVIMAAPDIDEGRFMQIMPPLLASNTIKRVTMYGSHKDLAMWLSHKVNGVDAVGEMPPVVPLKGVDEVDVSNLPMNFLGHDYFLTVRPVLDDMSQVLELNSKSPPRFSLVPATQGSFTYWRFSASSQ
ncbi:alpha/beta hydrolase [Edaphobacter sp. DSM 109919]|uniref:Alpha/beta hydrolase n=1 Tax=Edaphobacter paludis TaxID=3035702 RepID=A0AAU7CX78_9BACT